MHVAGEAKVTQIIEEVVAEASGAFEPGDVGVRVAHGLEKLECVLEARRQHKAAPFRQPPNEEFERGLPVLALSR